MDELAPAAVKRTVHNLGARGQNDRRKMGAFAEGLFSDDCYHYALHGFDPGSGKGFNPNHAADGQVKSAEPAAVVERPGGNAALRRALDVLHCDAVGKCRFAHGDGFRAGDLAQRRSFGGARHGDSGCHAEVERHDV